jgi:hypothetical protein
MSEILMLASPASQTVRQGETTQLRNGGYSATDPVVPPMTID